MSNKELYVERREEGDYAIRRPGSERASDVRDPRRRRLSERVTSIQTPPFTLSECATRLEARRTSGADPDDRHGHGAARRR